jgi:ATP-dependent Clp protease, protease subunit
MTSYYDYNWGLAVNQDYMSSPSKKRRKELIENENENKINFVETDDIYIYAIGNEIFFSSPITLESIQKIIKLIHKLVSDQSKKSKTEKLIVRINIDSPGGSVLSVLKYVDFINMIKKNYKNVEFISIITGLAASAGTIMALCAHKRCMTKNAYAMIHELSGGNVGKYTFLSSHMEFINKLHEKLVAFYVETTGKSEAEIKDLMKNETWFSAKEYLDMGFISEIL